jgi:hypothetical protein
MRYCSAALAALIALTLVSGPAFAQAEGAPPTAPTRRRVLGNGALTRVSLLRLTPALEQRLKITPDQKAKFAEIQGRTQQSLQGQITRDQTPEQRREGIRKFQEAQLKAETEAEALLVGDQKKTLEAIRTDAEQFQGLGRYSVALLAVSDLTAEQRSKLTALAADTRQKRGKIFQENRDPAKRAQLAAAFRAQQQQIDAGIKAILTPAQAKVVEENLPRGAFGGPGGRRNP